VPRDKFDYTPERRQFFKTYADIKFGKDVMTFERLDALFASPIISHLLVFTDAEKGGEIGVATLYLEGKSLAFYYYAFYDLNYYARNLGMFMMTSAVALFAERGCKNLYLGTCYSDNALYKTQFAGAEFFNGFRWSDDLDELKFIIKRDKKRTRVKKSAVVVTRRISCRNFSPTPSPMKFMNFFIRCTCADSARRA
jgi:hypothetical protein